MRLFFLVKNFLASKYSKIINYFCLELLNLAEISGAANNTQGLGNSVHDETASLASIHCPSECMQYFPAVSTLNTLVTTLV